MSSGVDGAAGRCFAAPMGESDSHRLRYEQWVRSYAPALFRYAYRLSGARSLAEDLMQETFLEAWKSMTRQTKEDGARGWLFQILRRRHAHYLRDTRHHREQTRLPEDFDAQPAGSIRMPLEILAEQDAIQAALNELPPAIRETFLMVFSEGQTCREAAAALGIPLGTVLSRLDSARRTLRTAMGDTYGKVAGAGAVGNLPNQRKNSAAS